MKRLIGLLAIVAVLSALLGGFARSSSTATAAPPTPYLSIETAANGTGTVVGGNTVAGTPFTVYAIERDASNAFIANVPATWTLTANTGGVGAGDLIPGLFKRSATFTGHLTGTAIIHATAIQTAHSANSGVVTVIAGAATKVRVETAPGGTGVLVPTTLVPSGGELTVYAVGRDAFDNYTGNVNADSWALVAPTGGVLPADLDGPAGSASATLTGDGLGSTRIRATEAGLASVNSGLVFVVDTGAKTQVRVETQADGFGSVVTAQSLVSGTSLTVYAIARDSANNFVANVPATWSLAGATGGVVPGDLAPVGFLGKSAVLTGHLVGTAAIHAHNDSLISVDSGTITVTAGAAAQVRVETAANGSGTVVPGQIIHSTDPLTVYAITRDAAGNFIANVSADSWTLINKTGSLLTGDLAPATNSPSATLTPSGSGSAKIRATEGTLTSVDSGTIIVQFTGPVRVRVETAADGSGTVVPAQTLSSGQTLTVYAISRDQFNNFIANVPATWSLVSKTGGVVDGDLVGGGASAVFSAHVTGTAHIHAAVTGLASTDSGTITVISPSATKVRVETAADGTGTVVPLQALQSGVPLTVYAISRDAAGTFVANVSATWSLVSKSGGVVDGDLVGSGTSAVFTGHVVGSAKIHAVSGILTSTDSGTLFVTPGVAAKVRVETAPNGSGTVVPAMSLASGAHVTVYAITRDASNNFIANVAADSWSLTKTGGVVNGDLVVFPTQKSATFTAHLAGTAIINVTEGALAATPSGLITTP